MAMQPRQSVVFALVQMLIWVLIAVFCTIIPGSRAAEQPNSNVFQAFPNTVKPLVANYCLKCHSTEKHKGDIDFEQFAQSDDIFKHPKTWERAFEQLTSGNMPPADKPQPTAEDRERLLTGLNVILDD